MKVEITHFPGGNSVHLISVPFESLDLDYL